MLRCYRKWLPHHFGEAYRMSAEGRVSKGYLCLQRIMARQPAVYSPGVGHLRFKGWNALIRSKFVASLPFSLSSLD